MSNSNDQNKVSKIILNIMEEQLKSSKTSSSDFQKLLEEQKIDEVIITSILPIYDVLKTLKKEKAINAEEYNKRIHSLMNILQLLQTLTNKNQ